MKQDVFMTEEQNEEIVTSNKKVKEMKPREKWNNLGLKPTPSFVGVAWLCLGTGLISYCIGLWNSAMLLSEKGFYFTLILFGLFSVISVQKCVRDRVEGIDVTDIYYGISWFTTICSVVLLLIGLRNADISLSEKGFFGMCYILANFAAVAVQKNTRDTKLLSKMD